MNLQDFISQEDSRALLERIFSKGVRVIYEDALQMLLNEREVLEKLLQVKDLPEEITGKFLEEFVEKPEKVEEEKKSEKPEETFSVIKNYSSWNSATPESFFSNFYSRYAKLSQLLNGRPQLKGLASIAQLSRVRGRERVSLIGMVCDIRKMKDGRKIIEVEDPTGTISVLVSPTVKGADSIVLDDVIGISGQAGRGIFFADEIVYPDIPISEGWPQNGASDVFIISDIHIGSKKFNEEIWNSFAEYINKEKRIKYLLIAGDLVDGVGIYQGQERELELLTAEEQYAYLSELIRKIRDDILIVAIPGNHDPTRDSEPQPRVPEEFAHPLYKIRNFVMLSNPAWIKIEGITFLIYHGTSLDALIDSIESIRNVAYKNPSKAQVELLRKRHLSPIYGRNRIFPDREDFLIIDPVPNVFVSGHVHTTSIGTYRGVRLISAGTFQERTAFQEKLGHIPTPGKFVRLELSTGNMKVIDFSR